MLTPRFAEALMPFLRPERPPEPAVAAALAALHERHPGAIRAVLYYGSCLRDGEREGSLLDFYVLTDDLRAFHGNRLTAFANRLVPPNVYYLETPFEGRTVRMKYAVMRFDRFVHDCRHDFHAALWARMSQPVRLVWSAQEEDAPLVAGALAAAIHRQLYAVLPLLHGRFGIDEFWACALAESYRTEFRSESGGRALEIGAADGTRRAALTRALVASGGLPGVHFDGGSLLVPEQPEARLWARTAWLARRIAGRLWQVLRLAKATTTFAGGLDYILWKIERHSGVKMEASDWQRRHPLLAAPSLAIRVYRRGGFR